MPSDWPRPVVHFVVQTKDLEKQKAFYRDMFDWDITQPDGAPLASIPVGKGQEGVGGSMMQTGTSNIILVVQVADLVASLKQAEELGGKATAQPFDVPNGPTVAQIEDPEGNLVNLVQM